MPKGMNGFIEPMIIFIRDEVAVPNIGEEKYERHMPYLLTVFFFILLSNILGLFPGIIPFGANVTGNIAVTIVLAVFTFVITQISGTKDLLETPHGPAGCALVAGSDHDPGGNHRTVLQTLCPDGPSLCQYLSRTYRRSGTGFPDFYL